jgi:His-Xaa-Ser system radical SAM maturase HxsC
MRRVLADTNASRAQPPRAVVDYEELASCWSPGYRYAARVSSDDERLGVEALSAAGLDVVWVESPDIRSGDVISLSPQARSCTVLFRAADHHHALFLTNRCNSYCLMCSQPPTTVDDGWLVEEAIEVVRHVLDPPAVLGITGGEPTLLGSDLARVTRTINEKFPVTRVEILTNARLLGSSALARELLEAIPSARTTWLVPLYGHADFLHDFVVQAPGAFEQTVAGLLHLQQYGHAIQLRTVLIEPVLQELPALSEFVARNLPFVREVALMAPEPIGFALANRDLCAVDLNDWHDTLRAGARTLQRYGIPFMFMNVPLCALPHDLKPYAQRSISDWKNTYAPECNGCDVRSDCCGLFTWYERGWRPAKLVPIKLLEASL